MDFPAEVAPVFQIRPGPSIRYTPAKVALDFPNLLGPSMRHRLVAAAPVLQNPLGPITRGMSIDGIAHPWTLPEQRIGTGQLTTDSAACRLNTLRETRVEDMETSTDGPAHPLSTLLERSTLRARMKTALSERRQTRATFQPIASRHGEKMKE